MDHLKENIHTSISEYESEMWTVTHPEGINGLSNISNHHIILVRKVFIKIAVINTHHCHRTNLTLAKYLVVWLFSVKLVDFGPSERKHTSILRGGVKAKLQKSHCFAIHVTLISCLGDMRGKFSRERDGQSVSLLNHQSKDCHHAAVSSNVFSIKFAAI